MIVKVTENIWYGDKPSVVESLGQVQSILNVAHSIRRPYWADLGKLDWRVWYMRLACPDGVPVDNDYMQALMGFLTSVKNANKFPLLCHCLKGRHRGPTAAFFAAFYLEGGGLDHWLGVMDELRPGFSKQHSKRVYRSSMIDYCRERLCATT